MFQLATIHLSRSLNRWLLLGIMFAPLARAQVHWESRSVAPRARFAHAIAQDSSRGHTVLFGGLNVFTPLGDTWEWDGADWLQYMPHSAPVARYSHAMAFDSGRGRTVLFGGRSSASPIVPPLADTWEWDGTIWTRSNPAASPPGRLGHSLVYEIARSRAVLFGGLSSAGVESDTWEWDGTTWTNATTTGQPTARYFHASSYDSVRGRTIVFGGFQGDEFENFNDLWEWDGSSWVQSRSIISPSERRLTAMAFDPMRGQSVLFGGVGCTRAGCPTNPFPVGDTLEWDGNNWTRRLPEPISGGILAFDSTRNRTILVVSPSYGSAQLQTWEWDGTQWLDRAPATLPTLFNALGAFDGSLGQLVSFAGTEFPPVSETWLWNGTDWSQAFPQTSPTWRYDSAMANDPIRERVLLFGGTLSGGAGIFNDTWEWDGANWQQRFPPVSPTARYGHAMAYDSGRQRMVLFGGLDGQVSIGDTWEWDGNTWARQTPPISPGPRHHHHMTYDVARGQILLYGGADVDPLMDLWGWDGTNWVELFPGDGPSAATGLTYDSNRQRAVVVDRRSTWELAN